MPRVDVWGMIQSRALATGIEKSISCHASLPGQSNAETMRFGGGSGGDRKLENAGRKRKGIAQSRDGVTIH
jgi:hypothetical protein